MVIDLYVNKDEKNKVDKTITDKITYTGNLKDETTVLNPVFRVKAETVVNKNYAYIPSFNRYYFIANITSIANGLWEISLNIDVLMTYKNVIKQSYAIIDKQENTSKSNVYLNDGTFLAESVRANEVIPFDDGFDDDGEIILITAGGN